MEADDTTSGGLSPGGDEVVTLDLTSPSVDAFTPTVSEHPALGEVVPSPAGADPDSPGSVGGAEATTEGILGDPAEALRWSQGQAEDGRCAVAAVGMVASRMLGATVDGRELAAVADRVGLAGPEGASLSQTAELLTRLGVPSEVASGDLEVLRGALGEGRGVILAVAAEALDGPDTGGGADHAVVLVGIDDHRGVAYLDDPGRPDGAGLEVPLERLLAAWAASDHQLVVTAGAATPGPPPSRIVLDVRAEPPHGLAAAAPAGFVLLPISLAASAVAARRRGTAS